MLKAVYRLEFVAMPDLPTFAIKHSFALFSESTCPATLHNYSDLLVREKAAHEFYSIWLTHLWISNFADWSCSAKSKFLSLSFTMLGSLHREQQQAKSNRKQSLRIFSIPG